MALRQIWKDTAAIGREASAYGTAPTNNLPWHEGGAYFMLPITDFSVYGRIGKSVPETRSGYREMNAYAPVVGNRWSEGGLQGDVLPASAGALLYMALGSCSSSQTADAANPLGSAADLSTGTVSVSNPTSAAFLRFVITSAAGSNMTITVSGTNPESATVSETINVTLSTGAATVQTRNNYTGTVTCTTSGFTSGACTVNGYISASHTFTLAETPASYTAINLGEAGRGSGEAGFYNGGLLTGLSFEVDAGDGTGRATYNADWMGQYPSYATAPTLYTPVDKPFAGWTAAFTRDGTNYYKVVRASLNIDTGNNIIWTADGDQDPRYSIGGPFGVSGQLLLLAEDDTEWGDFEDNSERDFHMSMSNSYDSLSAAVDKSLTFELTRTYYSNAQPTDYEGAQAIQVDFTTIRDSSDGAIKATLVNNVYSY